MRDSPAIRPAFFPLARTIRRSAKSSRGVNILRSTAARGSSRESDCESFGNARESSKSFERSVLICRDQQGESVEQSQSLPSRRKLQILFPRISTNVSLSAHLNFDLDTPVKDKYFPRRCQGSVTRENNSRHDFELCVRKPFVARTTRTLEDTPRRHGRAISAFEAGGGERSRRTFNFN